MTNLIKKIIFGSNVQRDEREEEKVYEIYSSAAVLTYCISLLVVIYDLITNHRLTNLGIPSLFIVLLISYYIMYKVRKNKIHLHSKNASTKQIFLSSTIFFSVFTLLMYLFGETITLFNVSVYLVMALLYGVTTYKWNNYNNKQRA